MNRLEYWKRQRRAHRAVASAIKKGLLVRPKACVRCRMVGRIEAHHDDYDRPLDVIFLCSWCHKDRHTGRDPGEIERAQLEDFIMAKATSVAKVLVEPLTSPARGGVCHRGQKKNRGLQGDRGVVSIL